VKLIKHVVWLLRYHLKGLLAHRSTIAYLNRHCVDWTLESHDWPPHAYTNARYIATACGFWEGGKAIGHTPGQAARRAIRQMNRAARRQDRKELLQDIKDLMGALNDIPPTQQS